MLNGLSSYRRRLTVIIAGVAFISLFSLIFYTDHEGSRRIAKERGNELLAIANGLSHMLGATLTEREREMVLLSQRPLLVSGNLDSPETRHELERIKHAYRYYAWIGVTDKDGIVISATGELLQGLNVSERPWFIYGRSKPYIGDAHKAVLLAKKLPNVDPSEPMRFVDFAAPILNPEGNLRGVVATHALWNWVAEVINNFLPQDASIREMDIFIVNSKNELLHPYASIGKINLPVNLPISGFFDTVTWNDDREFLTAVAEVESETVTDIGWRVVLRQPIDIALLPIRNLHLNLLILGIIVTSFTGLIAYFLARTVSRPVEQLVHFARLIEQGNENTHISVESNLDEIRLLADAISGMTVTLLTRKQDLEALNHTLEDRVAKRTAELAEANLKLEHLVNHDVLTGLLNRRAFIDILHNEFLRMKRTEHPYAILLIDIDHFKQVNDTYGHSAGDAVLQQVAKTMKDAVRVTDHVARLGGEEFVVLLPETSEEGGKTAAEKIRAAVANSDMPDVQHVTISVGVAIARQDDMNEEIALGMADNAMYQAKKTGRNSVISVDDLDS